MHLRQQLAQHSKKDSQLLFSAAFFIELVTYIITARIIWMSAMRKEPTATVPK